MKGIMFSAFLLVCLGASVCNYANKETPPGDNAAVAYNITYKLDGVAKTATNVTATINTTQNSIQIIGFSDQEGINLTVNTTGTGTFDVAKDSLLLGYSTDTSYENTYLALSGTLSITALTSSSITGTFSFSGSNGGSTKVITGGKFNCRLVKI